MADALDSGSSGRKAVEVQVLLSAPMNHTGFGASETYPAFGGTGRLSDRHRGNIIKSVITIFLLLIIIFSGCTTPTGVLKLEKTEIETPDISFNGTYLVATGKGKAPSDIEQSGRKKLMANRAAKINALSNLSNGVFAILNRKSAIRGKINITSYVRNAEFVAEEFSEDLNSATVKARLPLNGNNSIAELIQVEKIIIVE